MWQSVTRGGREGEGLGLGKEGGKAMIIKLNIAPKLILRKFEKKNNKMQVCARGWKIKKNFLKY